MKKFFLIKEYILYRLKAKNAHGIHSPFIYEMVCEVLNDKRTFYPFEQIESLRKTLLSNQDIIQVEDFGAGSHIQKTNKRRIGDIARIAGRSPSHGRLLFRIVNHYRCKHIIELGTSLGLATAYMASANTNATIDTVEGSASIAERAKEHFKQLGLNIQVHVNQFENVLEPLLKKNPFDLLFIDGNHRKVPTLQYFLTALPYAHENSMIIFDDIHWSQDMKEAWEEIRQHKSVRCSIDLFQFGIVLFRTDFKEKQHFILRCK